MSESNDLQMSRKERARLEVFARVRDGEVSVAKAAVLLGLSERQARRSYKRYRERGDAGLVHGLRGKAGNCGAAAAREAVLKLYREKYHDFGPTLAAEKLAEEDGYEVNRETLRGWLVDAGLWEGKRKRKKHRSRRTCTCRCRRRWPRRARGRGWTRCCAGRSCGWCRTTGACSGATASPSSTGGTRRWGW
jgi:transposase